MVGPIGSIAPVSSTVRIAAPSIIEVRDLVKVYPAVRALDGVSLSITPGEVRGVIGENGAGKSTLMKILSGVERPTHGHVLLRGEEVQLRSPHDAQQRGIAMIHQELNLVDELSVADNIFLGREHTRGGLVAASAQRDAARQLLARVRSTVDPHRKVRVLSIAEQQLVEIAKALSVEASILIMDEPTAVLTERETASLFDLIAQLKSQGVTILYISHILPEVLRVCDRVTVLRDGRLVTTIDAADATESDLARLMVGREMKDYYPAREPAGREVALRASDVTVPGWVEGATFEVRRGEILGFAGLIGAGRTELAEAVAGLRPMRSGTVERNGRPIVIRSPRDALRQGIAYLSEDRKGRGLTLDMGVAENITLVSLRAYCRPLIRRSMEARAAREHVRRLGIRCGPIRRAVRTLSGGNQQKVAIAKWLEMSPDVLILDEPTRGVDIGAKKEIYELIRDLARQGRACVFISSELPELLGVCHRIAVMRAGRIVNVLDGPSATEEQVMHLAAGVEGGEAKASNASKEVAA